MIRTTRHLLLSLLLISGASHAALEPLSLEAMQAIEGQGGADMSLIVSLNHGIDNGGNSTNQLSSYCATNYKLCHLGLSFNNRNDDGTVTGSATGKKIWLVFKGIQGTINLQHVALDGTDLTYKNDTGSTMIKAAIQLSFDPVRPILLRNVGFESLSIETDTVANEGADNSPGYLAATSYASAASFDGTRPSKTDMGRETGFMGVNIHGNLVLAGTIKIFSCDGSHPRC